MLEDSRRDNNCSLTLTFCRLKTTVVSTQSSAVAAGNSQQYCVNVATLKTFAWSQTWILRYQGTWVNHGRWLLHHVCIGDCACVKKRSHLLCLPPASLGYKISTETFKTHLSGIVVSPCVLHVYWVSSIFVDRNVRSKRRWRQRLRWVQSWWSLLSISLLTLISHSNLILSKTSDTDIGFQNVNL